MKLIKSMFFGLGAAAAVVACSSSGTGPASPTPPPSSSPSSGSGYLGMQLTLPGGEHFSKVTYDIYNTANNLPGSYNISATGTLSFTVGSVPAGSGYFLTLSTTSDDGTITCSYPAVDKTVAQVEGTGLSVLNRTTTTVDVNMQCVNNQGLDSGSILVNANTSNCPVWNTIVANPENITLPLGANVDAGPVNSFDAGSTAFYPNQGVPVTAVINDGQSLVLVGSATGPNPGGLMFTWTSSGGTISATNGTLDPNSTDAGSTNQTVFTCPAAPNPTTTYTVTLSLNDGALPANCDAALTTGTVSVQCVNPSACGGNPYALSNGGTCYTNASASTASPVAAGNDSFGFPYVTTGSVDPNNPGDYCCSPACADGATLAGDVNLASTTPAQALPFTGGVYSATGTCTGSPVNGVSTINVSGCCLPLLPCSAPGSTYGSGSGTNNCIKCQGNTSGLCTQTEALFVQRDISAAVATTPGNDPAAGCYSCLLGKSCLDDNTFSDTNHECGDLGGSGITTGTTAQCISTVSCILGNNCAAAAVNICYCGSAPSSSTCNAVGSGNAANGSCDSQIATGTGFAQNDGHDILVNLENPAYAAGMADNIFQCALSNSCYTQCQ